MSGEANVANGGAEKFVPVPCCWVCGENRRSPMQVAPLSFTQFVEQDPELASYSGTSVMIVRCAECGFGQPESLPTLENYFNRMYDQQWSREWMEGEFVSDYKDLIFDRILKELRRRVDKKEPTVLDIGAHVGRFLKLATQAGFVAEGIELNPRTAAYAAEATGLPVHRVNAHELSVTGRRYDAVTITDVLEHIPDPRHVLKTLHQVLSPGGWIAVKVPHGRVQLLKERVRERIRSSYRGGIADNLIHVNQFGVRSLRLALLKSGFSNVSIEVGAPELLPKGTNPAKRFALNSLRLATWTAARAFPLGTESPLGLHLQAFAQA